DLETVHMRGEHVENPRVGVGLDGVVQLGPGQGLPYGRRVLIQTAQVINVGGCGEPLGDLANRGGNRDHERVPGGLFREGMSAGTGWACSAVPCFSAPSTGSSA